MTLEELRALMAAAQEERGKIFADAEARFADADDKTEVRGAFVLDSDGNPTGVRDAHAGLTETEIERLGELDSEEAMLATRLERAEKIEAGHQAGNTARTFGDINVTRTVTKDVFDVDQARSSNIGEARGQLRTALESLPERAQDEVDKTVNNVAGNSARQEREIVDYTLAHCSPAYRSYFNAVMTGRAQTGNLTEAERRAAAWASETRAAITLTTGLAFPVNVDPTFIMTGAAELNPFRGLASVRTGTAPTHSVNTLGVASFAMANDGAEVAADGTPADASVTLTAQLMQGIIQYSQSTAQSQGVEALEMELGRAAGEEITNTEVAQFTSGTGSAPQLEGVLDGSTVTRVDCAATTAIVEADLIGVYNAIPVRHRANLAWMGSLPTHNSFRTMENTAGFRVGVAATIADSGDLRLMGARYAVNSVLAGPTTGIATFTENSEPIVVGNWSDGYRIYDQVGTTVDFIPHMFGTSGNLPNGLSGLYVRKRLGAGITNADALRILALDAA